MKKIGDARRGRNAERHTPSGEAFTRLVLDTFRLNGCLLATGDRLTRDLGLTSARWQVLGAIDTGPLPVAQIARVMGLSRQAVQRVADDLAAEEFAAFARNPNHRRAKMVDLTAKGRRALDLVKRRQVAWANSIAAEVIPSELEMAAKVLSRLRSKMEADDTNER